VGAPTPLDGLRRALARLGSQVRVRALGAPPAASARAAVPPEAAAHAIAPLQRGYVGAAAVAGASAVVRDAGPGAGAATVRGRAATHAAGARGGAVDPVRRVVAHAASALPRAVPVRAGTTPASPATARAVALPAPPMARRCSTRYAAVMHRAPLAWHRLERDRLRAAWDAVRLAYARDPADLELVGIYGPVPVSALAGAVVGGDRVAHLAFGPHRGTPVVGDLAFARHRGGGRLVSAVVTRPEI
jgi:hypothetical protein